MQLPLPPQVLTYLYSCYLFIRLTIRYSAPSCDPPKNPFERRIFCFGLTSHEGQGTRYKGQELVRFVYILLNKIIHFFSLVPCSLFLVPHLRYKGQGTRGKGQEFVRIEYMLLNKTIPFLLLVTCSLLLVPCPLLLVPSFYFSLYFLCLLKVLKIS